MPTPESHRNDKYTQLSLTTMTKRELQNQPHKHAVKRDALKVAREAAGLTQEEVARRLGVTGIAVSRWETGMHPLKNRDFIALAAIYGVSVRSLGGEDALDFTARRNAVSEALSEYRGTHYVATPLPPEIEIMALEYQLELLRGGTSPGLLKLARSALYDPLITRMGGAEEQRAAMRGTIAVLRRVIAGEGTALEKLPVLKRESEEIPSTLEHTAPHEDEPTIKKRGRQAR
jgi:transcriptional regulator with XRE-family HTH domain